MKKLFLLFTFCMLSLQSFAFIAGDLFIKNSRFWQNEFFANIISNDILSTGFVFDITEHKDIEDKIYAFSLPFSFQFDMINLTVKPFWYPDISNHAWAYGSSIKLDGLIRNDDINNIYANGYLKAAYANQKAPITRGITSSKENFKQWVFEGGLDFNFANLYNFSVNGNIFSYPDKVKDITYFGGVMNQNELADLGTIDYVLNFPNFSAGGGITWMSQENNTKTFLSYKYINYEHNMIAHSLMLKTVVPVAEKLLATLIYNHVFERHHTNKDLFGVGLNYLF